MSIPETALIDDVNQLDNDPLPRPVQSFRASSTYLLRVTELTMKSLDPGLAIVTIANLDSLRLGRKYSTSAGQIPSRIDLSASG